MTSLMKRYAENGFGPIDVEGTIVHPFYMTEFRVGDVVRLEWLDAKSPLAQGLVLRMRVPLVKGAKGRGGQLKVDDVESPVISLWMETAPPVVEICCTAAKPDAVLRISNQWRQENGREDEWFHNYGMVIEETSEREVVLSCSDGDGDEPSFDDLSVRLTFERAN